MTDITVVRQVIQDITITAQPTAAQTNTYYFQLSNLANASTFENLYDQYRLDAIRMIVKPQNNAIGLVTNSTTSLTQMYCVIDYDNDSALSSIAGATSYQNCVVLEPGESMTRTFQPRMALGSYSGAFTSFANVAPMWCDCASPSIRHYGIKFYVPGVTAAQTLLQSWDITFEYYVSFKSIF